MGLQKKISPEEWAATAGVKMAQKVMGAFLKEKNRIGEENYRVMFAIFLSGLVSAFLKFSLNEFPQGPHYSSDEVTKFAEKNFIRLKETLANALAAGVQGGVQSWSGQEVEYYVQIKPIPAAVNTKPC